MNKGPAMKCFCISSCPKDTTPSTVTRRNAPGCLRPNGTAWYPWTTWYCTHVGAPSRGTAKGLPPPASTDVADEPRSKEAFCHILPRWKEDRDPVLSDIPHDLLTRPIADNLALQDGLLRFRWSPQDLRRSCRLPNAFPVKHLTRRNSVPEGSFCHVVKASGLAERAA